MKTIRFFCILLYGAFLTFSLPSCSHLQRQPATSENQETQNKKTDRRILILIHGITGDATTFGEMQGYFKRRGFEVYQFVYETNTSEKTVDRFSLEFARFLRRKFSSPALTAQDQISMVMHSQGGLIGLTWLFRSLSGEAQFSQVYLPNLQNFVTFSTPFWGAKTAIAGLNALEWMKEKAKNNLKLKPQIEDMMFGSDLTFWFRKNLMDPAMNQKFAALKKQTRFFNFAGWAKDYKNLAYMTDGRKFESDLAVPIYSARMGFYYLQDLQKNYPAGYLSPASLTRRSLDNDFDILQFLHYPAKEGMGIASTPVECLSQDKCTHEPTLYLEKILNGEPIELHDYNFYQMSAFMLDLRLHFPKGMTVDPSDVQVSSTLPKFKIFSILKAKKPLLTLADPSEFLGSWVFSTEQKNQIRANFTGIAYKYAIPVEKNPAPEARYIENVVPLEIMVSGFKPRKVEVLVAPTYTSFVEINFEPIE